MYYYKALGGILACITVVKAQTAGFNPFLTPTAGQKILAGKNFDILWEPTGAPIDATVSIKLLQGDTPTTMTVGPNVASKIPSKTGRFKWNVPDSIKDFKSYGLIMYLDGKEEVFQYSFPFDIECLDNDENQPATPPVPKRIPSPKNPGEHEDHEDHEGHEDHEDHEDHDDVDDDDDDDDDNHHYVPVPSGVPYPTYDLKNGTHPGESPIPSAPYPPAAKPTSYLTPAEKPKPQYTSGAKMIAINSFALICGIAISIVF